VACALRQPKNERCRCWSASSSSSCFKLIMFSLAHSTFHPILYGICKSLLWILVNCEPRDGMLWNLRLDRFGFFWQMPFHRSSLLWIIWYFCFLRETTVKASKLVPQECSLSSKRVLPKIEENESFRKS
jgi:hypothetical protein